MTTTTVDHLAAARAAMTPTERGIFSALATGLDYTAAGLVADADTVNSIRRTAQILSGYVQDELDDQLTELLYDAGHEHCDDEGCTGGGRAWYLKTARRLSDPCGPLAAVAAERQRQDDKWGEQNHEDGTGGKYDVILRDAARNACQREAEAGHPTWRSILFEEVTEAFAETDPVKLRAELVQVAAVAAAWVECLDSRQGYSREAWYAQRPEQISAEQETREAFRSRQAAMAFRCQNEPAGGQCTGTVRIGPDEVRGQCSACGARHGRDLGRTDA